MLKLNSLFSFRR